MRTSMLTGKHVHNHDNEDIGSIEDIVLDLNKGRIAYAVLSFGGLMGLGNKLFAIPWEALQLDANQEYFLLNVSKEKLESAQGFEKDNWPDIANPAWGTQVYSYYGFEPYW